MPRPRCLDKQNSQNICWKIYKKLAQMPRGPNDHKSPDIIWNLNKLAQMPRIPDAQTGVGPRAGAGGFSQGSKVLCARTRVAGFSGSEIAGARAGIFSKWSKTRAPARNYSYNSHILGNLKFLDRKIQNFLSTSENLTIKTNWPNSFMVIDFRCIHRLWSFWPQFEIFFKNFFQNSSHLFFWKNYK